MPGEGSVMGKGGTTHYFVTYFTKFSWTRSGIRFIFFSDETFPNAVTNSLVQDIPEISNNHYMISNNYSIQKEEGNLFAEAFLILHCSPQ